MSAEDLIKLCKYYNGNDSAPDDFSEIQKLWFDGEKTLVESVRDNPYLWQNIVNNYDAALRTKKVYGVLADTKVDINKRAIIFYLDLWHGKNYPFDDLDLINEY